MAGTQQVVDVGERGLGQQTDALGLDGQDILALEAVDRDMVAADLAVLGAVFAEGEEIVSHKMTFRAGLNGNRRRSMRAFGQLQSF